MDSNEAYDAFVTRAERYCLLVEGGQASSSDFLDTLRTATLELYTAAVALPRVAAVPHGARVVNRVPAEQRQALLARLRLEIPFLYPRPVYNPIRDKGETVVGSLAEDVAAIWGALRFGLDALRDRPTEPQPEIWRMWRYSFRTYWGTHAIDALRVFHELLRDM